MDSDGTVTETGEDIANQSSDDMTDEERQEVEDSCNPEEDEGNGTESN
ncbi:MAG: hypothetical protein ACK5HR_03960 [Mycoplasmatales bacterium]